MKKLLLFASFIFLFAFNQLQSSRSKNFFILKEKYYCEQISNYSLTLRERLILTDSLISLCKQNDSSHKVLYYELEKSKIWMDDGEYLAAFENYRYVYEQIINIQNEFQQDNTILHEYLLESILQMGKCSRNMGLYEESTKYLFELLSIADNKKDINYIVKTQSFLGGVFAEIGNKQLAEKHQNEAIRALNSNSSIDIGTRASVYNNYAGIFYERKNYDSALYYILKAKEIAAPLKDIKSETYYLTNLALVYEIFNEDALAKDCFFKALDLIKNTNMTYTRVLILQGVARYYERQKDYNSAKKYYEQSIQLAQISNIPRLRSESLRLLADVFHKQGQCDKAYQMFAWSYALKDSVLREQNGEKIMLYSNRHENNHIQAENKVLQQNLLISSLKNERKNILLTIIICLILSISTFTGFIIKRLLKQNSNNKHLSKTISTVHEESKQMLDKNTQEFNGLLEEKNRKLASKALFLVQTQEHINSIKEYVQKCKEADNLQKKEEILSDMESFLNSMGLDKGWKEFRYYFEQVNGEFYEKLHKIAPELTKTELRLCALLSINLTAKEIAALTNRSIRTIETFNYRIRKKLLIATNVKTSQFLSNLLG